MAISEQQKRFVLEYVRNGRNKTAAYAYAYGDSDSESLRVSSTRLLRNATVREYLRQWERVLNDEAEQVATETVYREINENARRLMTLAGRAELLAVIADNDENKPSDRIGAIKVLNEMLGPTVENEQRITITFDDPDTGDDDADSDHNDTTVTA